MKTATTTIESARPEDEQYTQLLAAIRARIALVPAGSRLFTTDAVDLFATFLEGLPAERRQHYTCNSCRRFVDRFGGLVTIAADGTASPAVWVIADAPPFFAAGIAAVARKVSRAKVTGVFLSDEAVWGLPQNKSAKEPYEWHHMAAQPSQALVFKSTALQSASQAVAARHEEHGMLCRGLAEYPIAAVRQAHTLLTNGQLYRSEKCIGPAKWLLDLHEARDAAKGARRDNVTWLAVASAPVGFAHVRSGMIGTLLDDIVAGLPFSDIKAKFDAKMSPLQYQRPTAAPSAGNIAQAEKIVEALGIAPALARRFARIEDIETIWTPAAPKVEAPAGGVFGHLAPKVPGATPIDLPPVTMTWEKFSRTVLPEATAIEFQTPIGNANYYALVTAVDPDAKPIVQWDRPDRRNAVTWYVHSGGSSARAFNLAAGAWVKVTTVSLWPHMWHGETQFSRHGDGVLFVLDGAKDTSHERSGGFFPEFMRSELHGARATIEAHAQSQPIAGKDEASACGIGLRKGVNVWNSTFRVTSATGRASYKLDRWD